MKIEIVVSISPYYNPEEPDSTHRWSITEKGTSSAIESGNAPSEKIAKENASAAIKRYTTYRKNLGNPIEDEIVEIEVPDER